MEDELVQGDCLSDDSSFYGDEATQARLEKKAKHGIKRLYQHPWPHVNTKRRNVERLSTTPPGAKPEPQQNGDVLEFLKSRPQIAALHEAAASDPISRRKESTRTAKGEEAADLLDDNRFEGNPSAWQHGESVNAFLKRAPVSDPATARLGPWLWVSNPKHTRSQMKHEAKSEIVSFEEGGTMLLQAFQVQKAKIESLRPGAPPGTITRLLRPYREQLEDDLLTLAVKTSTTCGKWMLFPGPDDYARYWRLVAEATAEGKLGVTSKAATLDPFNPAGLICVYTYDFTDMEDVRRVVEELVDVGVCRVDSKPIYYKCDAYTYLDIKSDNVYRIKASLYSSQEILKNEAKAKQDGPVARLKKRNNTIDSFFA